MLRSWVFVTNINFRHEFFEDVTMFEFVTNILSRSSVVTKLHLLITEIGHESPYCWRNDSCSRTVNDISVTQCFENIANIFFDETVHGGDSNDFSILIWTIFRVRSARYPRGRLIKAQDFQNRILCISFIVFNLPSCVRNHQIWIQSQELLNHFRFINRNFTRFLSI